MSVEGGKKTLGCNKTALSAGLGAQWCPSVIPFPQTESWCFVPIIPVTPDENQQKCTSIKWGQRQDGSLFLTYCWFFSTDVLLPAPINKVFHGF